MQMKCAQTAPKLCPLHPNHPHFSTRFVSNASSGVHLPSHSQFVLASSTPRTDETIEALSKSMNLGTCGPLLHNTSSNRTNPGPDVFKPTKPMSDLQEDIVAYARSSLRSSRKRGALELLEMEVLPSNILTTLLTFARSVQSTREDYLSIVQCKCSPLSSLCKQRQIDILEFLFPPLLDHFLGGHQ